MAVSSNRARVVSDLAALLRENGEKILTGLSKLSLTTACLNTLNEGINDICDGDFELSFEVLPLSRVRQPLYHDLHFLYDFLQKTPALKIIHGSNTIQGCVNVSAFRALSTLQIKKVPVHMIEGLQKLRLRLSTLVCTRCVQTLQELLETCGGDMSTPMSWPELRALSLSHNNIEQLDNSLRLTPVLEILDLSHNCIASTENNLEYLTELRIVNLGYNSLQQVPIFAISARAKLRSLVLKSNDLEDIHGLEELSGLRDLDVSFNCISDHRTLSPLRHLHKLNKLKLAGNPICFHIRHRILTVENVSPLAVKQLLVDEKAVTQAESIHCEKTVPSMPLSWSPHLSHRGLTPTEASDFEISFESTGREDSDSLLTHGMAVSKKKSKKGIRMSRKVRRVLISDMDTTGTDGETLSQDGSIEPITTPTSRDHLEVKETLETIRTQLGPDWLPSLTAKHERAYQQAATQIVLPKETEDDIYLNDSTSLSGDMQNIDVNTTKEKDKVVKRDVEAQVEAEGDYVDAETDSAVKVEAAESEDVIVWNRTETDVKDYEGPESEPFIITRLDLSDRQQYLLTISDRYIHEKDLNGVVMELLDLQCLESIDVAEVDETEYEGESSGVRSEECALVKLLFSYLRKDRRERRYLMEDADSAEQLVSLLQPVLDAKLNVEFHRERMQCLKCNTEFSKSSTKRKVRKASASYEGELSSSVEKDVFQDVIVCPSCRGTLVIELDAEQVSKAKGSETNTPIGSFNTKSNIMALAVSSAKKEEVDSRESDSFQSASEAGTYYMSPRKTDNESTLDNDTGTERGCTSLPLDFKEQRYRTSPQDYTQNGPVAGDRPHCGSLGFDPVDSQSNICATQQDDKSGPIHRVGSSNSLRKRQDSSSSDIIVLSQRPSLATRKSTDSDITVMTNPSQSSILILSDQNTEAVNTGELSSSGPLERALSYDEGKALVDTIKEQGWMTRDDKMQDIEEMSPCGSLTGNTLSSMVNSVYESCNKYNSSNGLHMQADRSSGKSSLVGSPGSYHSVTGSPAIGGIHKCWSSDSFKVNLVYSGLPGEATYPQTTNDVASSNSFGTPSEGQSHGLSPGGIVVSGKDQDSQNIHYSYTDFSQVDHRLKLYLMMSVFDDNEEFSLVLRGDMVQYSKSQQYPGLLVASSTKLYILKITAEEDRHPEGWLKIAHSQQITDLQYVDIGLGYQSVHLEFVGDGGSFTILLRDETRCKLFIAQFTALIQETASSAKSQLKGISKNNPVTMDNLTSQVLLQDQEDTEEVDTTLLKFVMGYLNTGELDSKGETKQSPVSLVFTKSHICLATENPQWSLSRLHTANVDSTKTPQFKLNDRQKTNDITHLNLYIEDPRKLSFHFFDEESGDEYSWFITLETKETVLSLVSAIREPWEADFGVELQVHHVSEKKQEDS